MHWLVTGTRGGKPGRWKLEAADESAARQMAVAGGVAVQEVRAIVARPEAAEPPADTAQAAVIASSDSAPAPSEPLVVAEPQVSREVRAEMKDPAPDEFPSRDHSAEEVFSTSIPASEETSAAKAPVAAAPVYGSPKRRKSIWGIAAIAAGVLAAVAALLSLAHVPLMSLAGLSLAGAGFLLALSGVYFSIKRKRARLFLPVIGAGVCVAALVLAISVRGRTSGEKPTSSLQELEDRARAERESQASIQVQFIGSRPADDGKTAITLSYKYVASADKGPLAPVARLVGLVRFIDASGKEIKTINIIESFRPGLGATPIQTEGRWKLDPATAQLLQADPSQLKVEFDPFTIDYSDGTKRGFQ